MTHLENWEARKQAKTAYLEIWAKSEVARLGLKSEGSRYPLAMKKFVAELIDVYCSHSLPVYASLSKALDVTQPTLAKWRATITWERGQYVPQEVRYDLDHIEDVGGAQNVFTYDGRGGF